jgi:hypothetical protein
MKKVERTERNNEFLLLIRPFRGFEQYKAAFSDGFLAGALITLFWLLVQGC